MYIHTSLREPISFPKPRTVVYTKMKKEKKKKNQKKNPINKPYPNPSPKDNTNVTPSKERERKNRLGMVKKKITLSYILKSSAKPPYTQLPLKLTNQVGG